VNPDAVGRSVSIELALDQEHDDSLRDLMRSRSSPGTAHPLLLARPLSLLFHLAIADEVFAADLDRIVHVDQRSWFGRPVPIGAEVQAEATVVEVGQHGSHAGVRIATRVLLDGATVFDGMSTFVAVGSEPATSVPLAAPRSMGEVGEVVAVVPPRRLTTDDVRRYAELSGDRNPIHLSDEAARAAGLPAPIVHGMLTLALVGSAAIERLAGGDETRLAHLGARFSRSVAVGAPVAIDLCATASDATSSRAVVTSDGRRVLRHAVVEILPAR
jgi:acyl dehydratase